MVSIAFLLLTSIGHAAFNSYLTLTLKNEWIQGEPGVTTLGRTNTIECLSLESEFYKPGAPETPIVHRPLKFVKRVDKATPKIGDAFGQNFSGTAVFRFYQPDPNGSGTEVNFLTVTLAGVRVKSQRILQPSTITTATPSQPLMEEVSLSYTSITIHHEVSGNETTMDVAAP